MWGMRYGKAQSQDLCWGLWEQRKGLWGRGGADRASRFLRLIHVVLEAVDRTAAEGGIPSGWV